MGRQYRIEYKSNNKGKNQVALFSNIYKKEGTAYSDGQKLEGPEAEKVLKTAYGNFLNDMYWLAMPWKWMDDGVKLKYIGPTPRGENTYDAVQLSFGKVGMTPGDKYTAYVSPKTHLMEHWDFMLQSHTPGSFDWQYRDYNGIKLASNHVSKDGTSINMGDVKVLPKVDDAFFTDPKHYLAMLK